MALQNKLTRRNVLYGLGFAGMGSALASFQNCSGVRFSSPATATNSSSSGDDTTTTVPTIVPVCKRALSIYDIPASVLTLQTALRTPTIDLMPVAAAALTSLEADHNPNAVFYQTSYYDQTLAAPTTQYLLTVDVGNSSRGSVAYHAIANANMMNLNVLTDLYVVRNDTGALILWHRVEPNDVTPSVIFHLDPTVVATKTQLTVVSHCLEHGYFAQTVDLSQAPLDYSSAVPAWQSGDDFGGSTLQRPLVAQSANGGQVGIDVVLHSPDFYSVTDSVVQVTLGRHSSKHGAYATNHYVAGGALLDQNGNFIAVNAEQDYSMAADHNLLFTGFSLSDRQVTSLRVIAFDTLHGLLMSFRQL